MKEIIISIFFNIIVAVLLKFYNKSSNPKGATLIITYNYLFSALFCYLLFKPNLASLNYSSAPWIIYLAMSILMPVVFMLIAASIKYTGIARTDIAQRMSLLITVTASFIFFKESYNLHKIIGLIIGFISIIFIFYAKKGDNTFPSNKLYLLVLIFFGLGIINILYKLIAVNKEFDFTTSTLFIFLGSFVVGSCITFAQIIKYTFKDVLWGLTLGIFNFGNVYFYLKAHQVFKNNPSIVFASMNLGVILLGSLVGIIVFKEKMNSLNYVGLVMALVAIIVIALSTY